MKIGDRRMKRRILRFIRFLMTVYCKIKFGKENSLLNTGTLWRSDIVCDGKGNSIIIRKAAMLTNCRFIIRGNNNLIEIGEGVRAISAEFYIEDDNNKITIGERTQLSGSAQLSCIEGTVIDVGKDCLFSSQIVFRTGDSHSVTDLEGNRINQSKNIVINDHVWIGNRAVIGKGVEVGKNCIVAANAVVTNSFKESNVVIGGVPARIIKKDINWLNERI